MKSPIIIGGLSNSGKTSLICALLILAGEKEKSFAAFKPFDKGLMKRYAAEISGDGEKFCQYMKGEPMESLVSPYCSHEDYPLEMSYRRDGIRIDWKLIQQRINILNDLYDKTFVEIPSGLFTSISESKMVIDWLKELDSDIVWLINPRQKDFERNLLEIHQLKESGLNFSMVFNNVSQTADQDFLFYAWEKIESLAGQQAEGMIPYLPMLEGSLDKMTKKLTENISGLVDRIINQD